MWRTLKPLLPADMVSFISYFESILVGTFTTSPLFSHDMCNQHDASLMLILRSSNIAEGWRHGFHSMLSCSNPTLGKFLDPLKSEQALTDHKLARRKLRQLPEPRAPKWIKYDQRLQKIADDFESYTNVLDYLEAVGNMIMLNNLCGVIIILYLVILLSLITAICLYTLFMLIDNRLINM